MNNPYMVSSHMFAPQQYHSAGTGLGGSQIPMPTDPTRRLFANASQAAGTMNMSNGGGWQGYTPSPNQPQGNLNMTGGWDNSGGTTYLNQGNKHLVDQAGATQRLNQSGGVNPGVAPQYNSVQLARMQGQGGPPPGMAGRDPTNPHNAVLAAYPGQ